MRHPGIRCTHAVSRSTACAMNSWETWPRAVPGFTNWNVRPPAGPATNRGPETLQDETHRNASARYASLLLLLSPYQPKQTFPLLLLRPPRREAPMAPTVEISHLSFTYPGIDGRPPPGAPPLIEDVCFSLDAGHRCLLLGSNGAGNSTTLSGPSVLSFLSPVRVLWSRGLILGGCWGVGKTTILKILGGKHMVDPSMVRVLGRSAFHDTALTSSGDLCYLGGEVGAGVLRSYISMFWRVMAYAPILLSVDLMNLIDYFFCELGSVEARCCLCGLPGKYTDGHFSREDDIWCCGRWSSKERWAYQGKLIFTRSKFITILRFMGSSHSTCEIDTVKDENLSLILLALSFSCIYILYQLSSVWYVEMFTPICLYDFIFF